MINETKPNLSGVFAAALTRQNADGSPDLDGMARHCRWLLANGCDGLAILGTTGEANSFSVAERIAKEQGEKARKAEADARLRADVADTDAGRAAAAAGRGGKGKGGGKGSRVSWKKAAADLSKKSAAAKEALEAQVRELKVQLLAAQALAPRPPAAHPPAAAPPAPR